MTTLSNVWVNADGLAVRFGANEGAVGKLGGFEDTWGELQVMSLHFDFSDIPLLANILVDPPGILDWTSAIRKGSRIQEVRIWAETAMVGVNATLDVGLIKDDFATELDYNGLIVAMPTTVIEDNGAQVILNEDSTYAGALIGTTLSFDGFPTVNYNTAAFTAGKAIVSIYYYLPVTT